MSTGVTQTQPVISLLERDKIIPDALPCVPPDLQGKLDIAYPTHVVSIGENVQRVITKDTPIVRFTPFPNSRFQAGPETKYTVIMVDSDLTHPNDRLSGQVRHWLRSGLVFTPDENGNGAGDGTLVGKPSDGVPALTEYLECAPGPPGHAHRYIFILARESSTSAPQPTDFPSTQLTHAPSVPKDSENLADRAGFNVHEYLEKKGMPVVGVTYMFVAPDVESLVDNVGIMAGTVVDKVMGR